MIRKVMLLDRYFTEDQLERLFAFAGEMAGPGQAVSRVLYHIAGMSDLGNRDTSASLLRALRAEDWNAVHQHSELAGNNDLLIAIVLQIDTSEDRPRFFWIALRAPGDYLESASLITYAEIISLPDVSMSVLSAQAGKERRV